MPEHCEASPNDGHSWCCHAELNPDEVVTAARRKFFASTSARQRVLLAMGPGTPRLRLSEITDRVNLYPGDFVPSVEATLRELRNDGAAMLQEQRGRILQAYKSR